MANLPDHRHEPLARSRPGKSAVDPDLHEIADLVHQQFDGRLDPRVVDECLDQVAARFASAPIRTFVPLLVHRYVREELQARHERVELVPGSPSQMPAAGVALSDGASTPRRAAMGHSFLSRFSSFDAAVALVRRRVRLP